MNIALLTLLTRLQTLTAREDGQSLVEYSLILGLIAVGSVALLKPMGTAVVAILTSINAALQTA